jgi:hypothetical protein
MYIALVIAGILFKSVLAVVTPTSIDFINIATGAANASYPVHFLGPYTFSIYFINFFYRIWLILPVDHSQWIYPFIPSYSSYLLVYFLKLPLLLFDILACFVLHRLVLFLTSCKSTAMFASLVWILNPYLTIAIEMDGTMDIISTFLVLAAGYLYLRDRLILSGASLALATISRFYPITLVPFFAFIVLKERRVKDFCILTGSYLVPLTLALIPLFLTYGTSIFNALYTLLVGGNKEFTWFFGFRPSVFSTSATEISSVVTALTVVALLILKVWKADRRLVLDAILIALLTFLGFSHWNRYYTIWATPFLTVDMTMNRNGRHRIVYTALFILFFVSAFLYNGAYWWLSSGLFLYERTPTIMQITQWMKDFANVLRVGDLGTTFSQSTLSAACILYALMINIRNMLKNRSQMPRASTVSSLNK